MMAKIERNARHPSQADRQALREMADRVDPGEMIRCLGSIVANDHPDGDAGDAYRRRLFAIAADLAEDDGWQPADA